MNQEVKKIEVKDGDEVEVYADKGLVKVIKRV